MGAARLRSALRRLPEWALSIALPRSCVVCGGLSDAGRSLCDGCRGALLREPVHPAPPDGVAWLRVGARLDGGARRLVHGLKYEGRHAYRRDLVDLLERRGLGDLPDGAVLVPVPVTPERKRERGYNQSERLARELGGRIGVPVAADFLRRVRFRGSQTRRSGEERRAALAGQFASGPGFRKDAVPILVDDVLTTGATLSACAAACLHGGVPEVRAVCMAWAGDA